MRCLTFIFFFCTYCIICCGQQTCSGILLDSLTKQPIEFANIGLVGKGIGTVTNDQGAYSFTLPDSLLHESIKVSMVGYVSKTIPAGIFTKQQRVLIGQSTIVLGEVVVAAKKTKLKIVGNQTKTKNVSAGFFNNGLGAEIAVRLNIKYPQTQIRRFMLNINRNAINKLPVFRLNIYSINEKGYPKENIVKQNILIEPKDLVCFLDVDLTPYNIYADDDVFIAIEWIKDLGDVKGLYFSTKLVGSPTFYRKVSQDKWQKIPAGMGLHAEIAY